MKHVHAVSCLVAVLVVGSISISEASVGLKWRPAYKVLRLGESLRIGLYAASDTGASQPISALDAVMTYDPAYLHFYGLTPGNPPPTWLLDGFFSPSPDDINLALDDGDMMYTAWAQLGVPAMATRSGLLVTTLGFFAEVPVCRTVINVPLSLGGFARTRIFDGVTPNTEITGSLGAAKVMIVPAGVLISVAEAKALSDDVGLELAGPIVTRRFESYFYMEDYDRTAGIRVNCDPAELPAEGATPTVSGTITTADGERVINASEVTAGCPMDIPGALGMSTRTARTGLSPVGLLVRAAGTVTSAGGGGFTLGDGSESDLTVELHAVSAPDVGTFVAVTGALGADLSGLILRVNSAADIRTYP